MKFYVKDRRVVELTQAQFLRSHQKILDNLINSALKEFNDCHDAKIESNIDYISWNIAENQRIQRYWKPLVKLNNIICGCYIIRAYTLILVFEKERWRNKG